jgi:hypothetical protein
MRNTRTICLALASLMALTVSWPVSAHLQQDESAKKEKKEKSDKKKEEGRMVVSSRDRKPVLWTEPENIESLDLFAGPGGPNGAPNPNDRYVFKSRAKSGTSEKINVVDSSNREWQIKFGAEARPAPVASRIVWAVGYHTDLDYFVKRAHVEGRGGFDVWDVRFKNKDDGFKEEGTWSWHANPFMGTRELDGLKVLMAVLSNWDLKEENNKVIRAKKKSGGDRDEDIYYVSDLGGTLGKTGSPLRKIPGFGNAPAGTKGDVADYSTEVFIAGVRDGQVIFNYKGKDPKALEGVKVANARWMGELLDRLSDKQIADAFRAGGFSDEEIRIYVRAFRGRINQLKNLR